MLRISCKYLRLSLLEETHSLAFHWMCRKRCQSWQKFKHIRTQTPRCTTMEDKSAVLLCDWHVPSQGRKYCPVCFLVFFMSVGLRLSYRREAEVISGPQSYFLSLPGFKVVFACSFSPLNEEVDYFKIFPTSSTFSKDCYLWRVVRCCKTKRVL